MGQTHKDTLAMVTTQYSVLSDPYRNPAQNLQQEKSKNRPHSKLLTSNFWYLQQQDKDRMDLVFDDLTHS